MPTSTLARVVHRTILRPVGVRATANTSRHFFLPTTVIPIQRSPPHYQQRFATADTSGGKRGRSGSGGSGKAPDTLAAADIDADLDYPIEMDEKYSTTSWSDTSAGTTKSASASPSMTETAKTASEMASKASKAASDAKVGSGSRTDNTIFYLAMGLIGLTGAYIVLKPNPSASVEPRVDARSSSSHLQHDSPAHRPLNSKTEKMIGRSG
ncbi:hypothetical protein N0V85_007354 [Neurospora sp. IMI 360204]|nr:hypothetical protein N0V85_007354 [Neurospora sp. IMI 360204]